MSDDDFVRRINAAADALPTVAVPTARVRHLARRRRARQALLGGGLCVAASGAVVLGAAAVGPATAPSPSTPAGRSALPPTTTEEVSALDEWLEQARADDGVGEAQLAALELAARTGYLTYEQIDALLEDTAACMADAGVRFDRHFDEEVAPGILVPTYTHGEPLERADACLEEHSHYAYGAYQTQARHREAQDADLTQRLPDVVACLRQRGATLPDDATLDEVRAAEDELFVESLERNDDDGRPVVPCTSSAGW